MCKGKQIRWTMLRNMSFQKVNSTFSVIFFWCFFLRFFFNLADFGKGIFFHSETFCVSIEPRSFKLWVLRRRWTAMTLNGMLPPRRSHRSFSWPKRWKALTKQRQQMQRQPISLPQFSMSESYRFAPWNIFSFSSRSFSRIQIRPRKVSGLKWRDRGEGVMRQETFCCECAIHWKEDL